MGTWNSNSLSLRDIKFIAHKVGNCFDFISFFIYLFILQNPRNHLKILLVNRPSSSSFGASHFFSFLSLPLSLSPYWLNLFLPSLPYLCNRLPPPTATTLAAPPPPQQTWTYRFRSWRARSLCPCDDSSAHRRRRVAGHAICLLAETFFFFYFCVCIGRRCLRNQTD